MSSELLTKTRLKTEYGLTDRLIRLLGEPDELRPNPHYRQAAPMALYSRERVEAFIASHADQIEASKPRKAAAARAVDTKRLQAADELETELQGLVLEPIPSWGELYLKVELFIRDRYDPHSDGPPSQKAVCSYIRHNYTNYEIILAGIAGKVGKGELYKRAKWEITRRIIEHYGLQLTVDEALKRTTL